jgi:hypothetical protein
MDGARGLLCGCGTDGGENRRYIIPDRVVRKAQDDVAGKCQRCLSLGVIFLLRGVDIAIQLDSEATVRAAEINDERSDGMLPTKLQAIELAIA